MRLIATILLILGLGSGPAVAQSPPPTLGQQADEAARAMREAIERAMRVFDGVIGSIPQYEMPEILPNGDIIIRRIPQSPRPPSPRAPDPEKAPGEPKLEET